MGSPNRDIPEAGHVDRGTFCCPPQHTGSYGKVGGAAVLRTHSTHICDTLCLRYKPFMYTALVILGSRQQARCHLHFIHEESMNLEGTLTRVPSLTHCRVKLDTSSLWPQTHSTSNLGCLHGITGEHPQSQVVWVGLPLSPVLLKAWEESVFIAGVTVRGVTP